MVKIINKKTLFIFAALLLIAADVLYPYFEHKTYEQCRDFFYNQKYSEAVQACAPLSDNGNEGASLVLGIIYLEGWHGNKDFEESYNELIKAEESEDLAVSNEAKVGLGDLYKEDKFSQYNLGTSYKWYKSAASKNHSRAQLMVGAILFLGHGVPKNLKLAKEYLLKAAKNGENEAEVILKNIDEKI